MGAINTSMDIQKNIKRGVELKKFTTFKIGGPADFFISVHNVDELKEVLLYAQKKRLKIFVLGGGSNTVFSDDGFRGLVIKIEIKGIVCRSIADDDVILEVGGGEVWDEFVSFCVSQGFYGVENLSAIPGIVGAAPVQNIGAYGVEVKDSIEWVEAIHIDTGSIKRFSRKECLFSYRNSLFKTIEGKRYIITKVGFRMKKEGVLYTSYADVSGYFKGVENPSLKDVREAITVIRSKKFPNLNKIGTAGSFFKNPIISHKEFKILKKKFPDIPSYVSDTTHVKVPLGFILEKLGWKGRKYKQVGTYKNQSLVVVSYKGATYKQLVDFILSMEDDVKDQTSIVIEREVTFVV